MSALTGRAYGFYNGKVKCIRLKLAAGIAPAKDIATGDVYYDAAANKLKFFNSIGWETVTSST